MMIRSWQTNQHDESNGSGLYGYVAGALVRQPPDDASVESGSSTSPKIETFEEYLPKIEQLLKDIGLGGFNVQVIQRGDFQNCVYALDST